MNASVSVSQAAVKPSRGGAGSSMWAGPDRRATRRSHSRGRGPRTSAGAEPRAASPAQRQRLPRLGHLSSHSNCSLAGAPPGWQGLCTMESGCMSAWWVRSKRQGPAPAPGPVSHSAPRWPHHLPARSTPC
eukprot:2588751-Rhodomonas_salina.2